MNAKNKRFSFLFFSQLLSSNLFVFPPLPKRKKNLIRWMSNIFEYCLLSYQKKLGFWVYLKPFATFDAWKIQLFTIFARDAHTVYTQSCILNTVQSTLYFRLWFEFVSFLFPKMFPILNERKEKKRKEPISKHICLSCSLFEIDQWKMKSHLWWG